MSAVQTFVATNASARRPPSAAASTSSARPYIGDESTTRTPASNAVWTTSSAIAWRCGGRSKTRHVPRPTTGSAGPTRPSRRVSIVAPPCRLRRAFADHAPRVLLELDALVGRLAHETIAGPARELGADDELGPQPSGVAR